MEAQLRRSPRQCRKTLLFTCEPENPKVRKPATIIIPPIPVSTKRKHFTKKRQGWVSELKMKVAFSPPGTYGTRSFQGPEFFEILCNFFRDRIPDVANNHVRHWIKLHPWIIEELQFHPPGAKDKKTPDVPVVPGSGNSSQEPTEGQMPVGSGRSSPNFSLIVDDILDMRSEMSESSSDDDDAPPFLVIETNSPQQSPKQSPLGLDTLTPPPEHLSAWVDGSPVGPNANALSELSAVYGLSMDALGLSTNIPPVRESVLGLVDTTLGVMTKLIMPVSYFQCALTRFSATKVEGYSL